MNDLKRAVQETIGNQILTHLDTLANSLENTAELAANKLDKLCIPENPISEKEASAATVENTYPAYFHEARTQIQRIETAHNKIKKIIDAVEI